MHYYQFNIADFNNSTRHLTRVERSLYRDMIDLYYDKESPLPESLDKLCRIVIASSEEEKQAVNCILDEFFTLKADGYHNDRCNRDIEKYVANTEAKRKAGKASAAKRQQKSTHVEQVLDKRATNHKPITNNQDIDSHNHIGLESASDDDRPPTNGCPYKKLEALYTRHCPRQTKIIATSWTPARKATVRNAWSNNPDEEWWDSFFEYCGTVKFLNGENDRGWKASMFWIMKPENLAKVTEKAYK